MDSAKLVDKALEMAEERRKLAPSFHLFGSIVAQLQYLRDVLAKVELDRSKLKDIIVGHYAVREFEETDPEFSEVLKKAQYVASTAARGLKI